MLYQQRGEPMQSAISAQLATPKGIRPPAHRAPRTPRIRLATLAAAVALLGAMSWGGAARAATPEDVKQSFRPYDDWKPEAPGVVPGAVINQGNVESFADVLDPALYDHVAQGWVELRVAETESLLLNTGYIDASLQYLNQPKLGPEKGILENYNAGRPFPEEPDADDPRAGEKMAWNYKYGYNWGDNAAIDPFYWKFRNPATGQIERTIKFNFNFLNFKHRVYQEPIPAFDNNPSDIFRGIYLRVNEPFDVKNTQLLIYRYTDDLQRDDAWLYLGFQRRVRRLATGQVTDSFLGSDLMIEDFEGYNGRISDYTWKYIKTKNVLLPFFNHNDMELAAEPVESDGYRYIDFEGRGGCFPKITWQLRKVYVMEAKPEDSSYPIGKRLFFVDAQTYTLPRQMVYDRNQKLWKSFTICQAHPDHHLPKNKGSGVSIDDCFMMMDVQADHCTTGQFKGQIDSELNPFTLFTVQQLRAAGR